MKAVEHLAKLDETSRMIQNGFKMRLQRMAITFFTASFALGANLTHAETPVLATANTPLVAGKTIQLSGANFGSRPSQAASYFSNFDSDTFMEGWLPSAGSPTTTSERYHSGQKSLLFDLNNSFVQIRRDVGPADLFYISCWLYLDNSANAATTFQYKSWRLTSDPDAYRINATATTTAILNDNWWKSDRGWYNSFAPSYYAGGTKMNTTSGASDQFLFNQWQRVEQIWTRSSAPDVADGKMTLSRVGRPGLIAVKTNYVTHTVGDKPWRYLMLGQAAINGTGGTPHLKAYYDDFYIDATQARVELCDSATWASRTRCEIQPSATWANEFISATANPGSFKSGEPAYLYVVDGNGAVSNPFKVVVGGPSPPANLRTGP